MATEKRRSKGGFLYLFDWNAKSRKKLFSNKGETSEGSIQEKESVDDLVIPHYLLELHSGHHSFRGSGNYSCVSSVNGDDGYGRRAPGVVARLMGLDTMPTMPSCEASSLSSSDSRAVSNSYYPRGAAPFRLEHQTLEYGYMPEKLESLPWSSMDPRRTKVNGRRPIERFKTEVLPPKSAKPISITHHKLLSPIKSPGFIPTKDAAYIMEAAARILDPSRQPSSRAKVPTLGSPSSSFRIQDLRDKINAAQRSSRLPESSKTPKHSTPVRQMKPNSYEKSSCRSLFKNIMGSETRSSQKVKNKGKSISVPVRDKANVQEKEGSVYSENNIQLRKEHKKVKLKQKQSTTQKAEQTRTSRSKTSGVLKQNNDKQNSVNHKERSTSKASIVDQQPNKVVSGDNSSGPSKIINKVYVHSENRPKKMVTATSVNEKRTPLNAVIEKRPSLNRMKNISRNKQFPIGDSQLSENVPEKVDTRAVQSDLSLQGDSRKDMDVISFTFTSPIKKSGSQSLSSIEDIGSNYPYVGADSYDLNGQSHTRSSSSPALGLSLIDSGSLSLLLEQKLKELTNKIVPTKSKPRKEGHGLDSMSCLSEPISSRDFPGTAWMDYDGSSDKDERSVACDDDSSSPLVAESSQKLEDVEDIGGHFIDNSDKCEVRGSDLAHLNTLIPECSVSGSLMSSNTTSDVTYGYDQPSSPQSQEVTSCISTESIHPKEDESDYVDAASFWELEYIRHVLHYAGLKRFGLGKDCNVIDICVFDLLENLLNNSGRNVELCSKADRKALFDCVADIVSSTYERVFVGSHIAWAKWGMLLQNEWLTEEVYKEIMSLQSMGHLMVDELVERDMSTQYGNWLDFEIESLEEGIEIEKDIVSSLIDELVDDLYIS